jgi:hypothetical protein
MTRSDSFLERNDFTRSLGASRDTFQRIAPPLIALWGLVFAFYPFPVGFALSAAALVAERRNARRWWVTALAGLGILTSLAVGGIITWVRFIYS